MASHLHCLILVVRLGLPTAADPDRPAATNTKELEALWSDLAETDPSASVPFLRTRLRPARPVDAATVARLVALLDSDNFDERETAQKELDGLGDPVCVHLRRVLAGAPSPETKRRLEAVLQQLDEEVLSSESLRGVRAVEALERTGTAEARLLVKELAGGAPGARLTREAQASLARMTTKP